MTDTSTTTLSTRRGFIGRISTACAAALAYVATRGTDVALAGNWHCCNLALPNVWCPNIGSCPSGYHFKVWFCCEGRTLYGCQECTTGADCFHGTFKCSRGYLASGPCP